MITVIIPVYNTDPIYLEHCLASVAAQTFRDFETLVVDDGSTHAATCALLSQYAERGDIRLIHQENAGVSAARNTGLAHAKGDWVTFIDSDDFIAPTLLADAARCIAPGIDGVWSKTRWVDLHGDELKTNLLHGDGSVTEYDMTDAAQKVAVIRACFAWKTAPIILKGLIPEIWAKLYRKSALSGLRFAEDIHISEDQLFTAEFLLRAEKIAVMDSLGYFYRQHPESTMNSRSMHSIEEYRKFFAQFCALFSDLPRVICCEKAYFTLRELLEIFDFTQIQSRAEYDEIYSAICAFAHDAPFSRYLSHMPLRATHVPFYDRILARHKTCRALIHAKHTAKKILKTQKSSRS